MDRRNRNNFTKSLLILTACGRESLQGLLTCIALQHKKEEDTLCAVDNFLKQNKECILQTIQESGEPDWADIVFPSSGDGTKLKKWSLNLLIWILKHFGNCDGSVRDAIWVCEELHNQLCEASEPTLTDDEFELFVLKSKIVLDTILAAACSDYLKKKVPKDIEFLREGLIGIEPTKERGRWYIKQNDMDKIIPLHGGGGFRKEDLRIPNFITAFDMAKVDNSGKVDAPETDDEEDDSGFKIETPKPEKIPIGDDPIEKDIIDKLKMVYERNKGMDLVVLIPLVEITILIDHPKEKEISSMLVREFKTMIQKTKEQRRSNHIKSAVNDALRKLLGNNTLEGTIHKCVILSIQCQTVGGLLSLIEDCMTGKMTENFKPVEEEIRKVKEYETASLKVVMYQEDFWQCTRTLAEDLKRLYMDEGGEELMNTRPYRDPLIRLTKPIECVKKPNGGFGLNFSVASRTMKERQEFLDAFKSGAKRSIINELTLALRKEVGVSNLNLELSVGEDETPDAKFYSDKSDIGPTPEHEFKCIEQGTTESETEHMECDTESSVNKSDLCDTELTVEECDQVPKTSEMQIDTAKTDIHTCTQQMETCCVEDTENDKSEEIDFEQVDKETQSDDTSDEDGWCMVNLPVKEE